MTKQIVYNINYNFILLRVGKILKKKTEFNYYILHNIFSCNEPKYETMKYH